MAEIKAYTNLDKLLKIFTLGFWTITLDAVSKRIMSDARHDGVFQDGTRGHSYKSKTYKEYKARHMDAKTLTRKIKPYDGVAVISNETRFVNATLTGKLLDSIKYKPDRDGYGGVIYWELEHHKKLEGLQDRGYDLIGLTKENRDFIIEEILKRLDPEIRKEFEGNITINVN
jgi:hypothetical protein